MIDIIASFGIWAASLVIAAICIKQSKGCDWYAPVSKKQKMIMTVINLSLLLFISFSFVETLITDIKSVIFASIICLLAIVILSQKFYFKKNKSEHTDTPPQILNEENPKTLNSGKTLMDLFQKYMTVFNISFTVLNIIHVVFIYADTINWTFSLRKSFNDASLLYITLEKIFKADRLLYLNFTLLIVSTLATALITMKDWKYNVSVSSSNDDKSKAPKKASYYASRITNRNRK